MRRSSVDSTDTTKAAGESSLTDPSAFIEQQRQLLHELESSRQTDNRDNDGHNDIIMQDEDRTCIAEKLEFQEGHYRSTSPKSSVRDDKPITTQPGYSNFSSQDNGKMYSDYVDIDKQEYANLIGKHPSARGGKCETTCTQYRYQ